MPEVHGRKPPPSSEHSKCEPVWSGEKNETLALLPLTESDVIVVCGGPGLTIDQLWQAELPVTAPPTSAATHSECGPAARPR